jgi:hypothetical protein
LLLWLGGLREGKYKDGWKELDTGHQQTVGERVRKSDDHKEFERDGYEA